MNPITLVKDTLGKDDIQALCEWLSQDPTPRLTKGELTLAYENAYAKKCDRNHAVFVSSGSSANLIALYALVARGDLPRGSKVVIPGLAWATTLAPVIQFGLHPIFCDVEMRTLGADPDRLEDIFKKHKPECLFLVSVLGMPPMLREIEKLCQQYNVILLMDNCESQNTHVHRYAQPIEKFGLMSTCSSYMGHITSTIEGGMITTDDDDLYYLLLMLRSHGWDRDLPEFKREKLRDQFGISGFHAMYTFYEAGFNVRNTEIGAFLGLRQLEKLDMFTHARHQNFKLYMDILQNDYWMPTLPSNTLVSNLGFPVIHPRRNDIVEALTHNNIECRPLVSGSMRIQPMAYDNVSNFKFMGTPNADSIDREGMYIPNHPYLSTEDVDLICKIINTITDAS